MFFKKNTILITIFIIVMSIVTIGAAVTFYLNKEEILSRLPVITRDTSVKPFSIYITKY